MSTSLNFDLKRFKYNIILSIVIFVFSIIISTNSYLKDQSPLIFVFGIGFWVIFTVFDFYMEIIVLKRISKKRLSKVLEFLHANYNNIDSDSDSNLIKFTHDKENIFLNYKCSRGRDLFTFENDINIGVDISDLTNDQKRACKIQYYCQEIDDKVWITYNKLIYLNRYNNYLHKKISKTVNELIKKKNQIKTFANTM